jgi:hypothetical protein
LSFSYGERAAKKISRLPLLPYDTGPAQNACPNRRLVARQPTLLTVILALIGNQNHAAEAAAAATLSFA